MSRDSRDHGYDRDRARNDHKKVTESSVTPRVDFLIEQTLGHVTHSDNLRQIISESTSIQPAFRPIDFAATGFAAKVPGYGNNWSVRAGLRA